MFAFPARQLHSAEELVLTNARIVTADEVVTGTLRIRDGVISDVERGATRAGGAVDCCGDFVLPGLIEMHTDNLEKHLVPRPGVEWPSPLLAILAHDVQIAGAGITTVLDAISVGEYEPVSKRNDLLELSIAALRQAGKRGLLRIDHLLHLRCEYGDKAVVDLLRTYIDDPLLRLVSLMDHTPGQRQWRDMSKWRQYHSKDGWSEERAEAVLAHRLTMQERYAAGNREKITALCRERNVPLASHDDTLFEHVEQAVEDGVALSEFPTTLEAASLAHDKGMRVVMGAPNVVRGGSHSGNVSALEVAQAGCLDILSSDYAPKSLLHAAFELHAQGVLSMPEAASTVTANVADAVGLDDRGRIAEGLRADLVRVTLVDDAPVARTVWRQGKRVL